MTKEIQLSQGKVALVDDEDYEELNQHKWCAMKDYKTFYAMRSIQLDGHQHTLRMHNAIMGTKGIDHKNNDGLDNRRDNLRKATASQNSHNKSKYSNNTSGYRGVYWDRRNKKWRAQIGVNGKQRRLGYFSSALEAASAYDEAALELHGEFARTNIRLQPEG